MKTIYIKQLTFICFIFVISCSCNTTPFKQNIAIEPTNSLASKIDSIVASKMNTYNIPGLSIGIVKNDSILYTKGYGVKTIIDKGLVSENTIFHTASISKIFTAQAIMELVDQNLLKLNDRLTDIIPNLNYTDNRIKLITIKNLLNHTSGLPDITNYHWSKQNRGRKSLENYVLNTKLKLKHTPSKKYKYSSLGYDVLGYVIEKVTQHAFENFTLQYILKPYNMNSSSFNYFAIPNNKIAHPHSKWLNYSIYTRQFHPYTREHSPSSTLNSSSKDLSYWMRIFLKNLDTKPILKQMTAPSFNNHNIGLGFQLYDSIGENAIGHFGGDKGFRSFLLMLPEHQIGVVLLANCDYNEDFRQEIVFPITELLLK